MTQILSYIADLNVCAQQYVDIDPINIGRVSHDDCEGRRDKAMLGVIVHISCSQCLRPLLWTPTPYRIPVFSIHDVTQKQNEGNTGLQGCAILHITIR